MKEIENISDVVGGNLYIGIGHPDDPSRTVC